jgi:DNA-binding NarL/FixJ family response regulator
MNCATAEAIPCETKAIYIQGSLYAGVDAQLIACMLNGWHSDLNPNIRYLLRVFVESQTPFKVCGEAAHGTDAIEKARHLQPDLVLLDLSMPVMSGAEAASVLKAMLPRTKIILFSMHMDSVPRSLAAAIGVDLALSKSDGITKLGEHLKMLLAPIDSVDETPKLETPQSISTKPV